MPVPVSRGSWICRRLILHAEQMVRCIGESAHTPMHATVASMGGPSVGEDKSKLRELLINRQWCKGCGVCVAFCPKRVLELDTEEKAIAVRIEDCIGCRLCEFRCPDLAIEMPLCRRENWQDYSP